MSQPDKWDEMADQLAYDAVDYGGCNCEDSISYCDVDRSIIATALRSAYAEGEKAGMERAAVICDENDGDWANAFEEYQRGYGKEPMSLGDEIRRAAKETKE